MSVFDFITSIFSTSRDDINANEEKEISNKLGLTLIANIKEREQVQVAGVLQAVTYYPLSSSSSLAVGATLYDGSSSMDIIWLGRKKIPGINVGVHIIVSGVVVKQNGRLAIMNPMYEIVSEENI